jgi:predicted ATPase
MFSVQEVFAAGYRSLHSIRLPVERLTVFVGANGAGKTNLYRSLQILQAAASGTITRELATEGGMASAYWAGTRRAKDPVRISLGARLHRAANRGTFEYRIEVGLVQPISGAGFVLEPQVKAECLTHETGRRSIKLLDRQGPTGHATDGEGRRQTLSHDLLPTETALGALGEASLFPDLHPIRQTMLGWRFYHDFRTDSASPLRQPCLAVTTPTLSSDGSDLAAVFATLAHIRGDTTDLDQAVEDAFPGARLIIPEPDQTASFGLIFPDYPKRVFEARELSDGTLRYLGLAGALLAYRLPPFIALNEPETSLHPDLLEPLARMIVKASERSQVWLVTHSERLATALAQYGGVTPRSVIKRKGETWIEGLRLSGDFNEHESD